MPGGLAGQRGRVVRVLDVKYRGREFKFLSDLLLHTSRIQLLCHMCKIPSCSCQLGFNRVCLI